jgi:hypothetical protein
MTEGEIAYLSMAIVLFIAFFAVIGFASQTQKKHSER